MTVLFYIEESWEWHQLFIKMTRLLSSEDKKNVTTLNVFVIEHGPLLLIGTSQNREQLSINTASYVLSQSTVGK